MKESGCVSYLSAHRGAACSWRTRCAEILRGNPLPTKYNPGIPIQMFSWTEVPMRLFAFALFGCLAATFAGCSDKPSEQRTGNQTESKKDTSAASPTSAPKSNPVVFGYNCTSTAKMKTVRIPKPLPGGQNTFELVVRSEER